MCGVNLGLVLVLFARAAAVLLLLIYFVWSAWPAAVFVVKL
jgi:hypothetical protein